jgi:uncharacterized protein (DUF1778 family)
VPKTFVFDAECVLIQYAHIENRLSFLYTFNTYKQKGLIMPQIPVETNDRMSLRIASKEKSLLVRAAALQHTNLTEFVIRNVISVAQKIIDENERLELTERDSLHVLDLLDNPPAPNDKLIAAAFSLPKQS